MDGREYPLVHESFVAQGYEITIHDFELYGYRAIFEATNTAVWIAKHRLPRVGGLDIQATADTLGLLVLFDERSSGSHRGVTTGLPGTSTELEPLSIGINPFYNDSEQALTFGHEVGHVFLGLVLNLRHEARSHEVEKFCEQVGMNFVLPPSEIPQPGTVVDENLLLQFYEKYGIEMNELIYEFIHKGLLPERMYVDSLRGYGKDEGIVTDRDVICMPCRREYGSCANMPRPSRILDFTNQLLGGFFQTCANDKGGFEQMDEVVYQGSLFDQQNWDPNKPF